jgi:polar amino acid transport system substrate-binding protein
MSLPRSGMALPRRALLALSALLGAAMALPGGAAAQAPARGPKFDQALHDMLPASIRSAGVISFGGLWETPPIISVDLARPGVPKGIAPDLAAGMGEVLGVRIQWLNMPWPAQLPGLQAGNVDVLFGQISDTAERERSVADLIPFQRRGYGLLTAAGNPKKLAKLTDLCGVTIAVPIGSVNGAVLRNLSASQCTSGGKAAIVMREFNGATAMVQALRAGSVDAVFDSAPNLATTAASDTAAFEFVALPTDYLEPEYSAIAVSKENPQLTKALAEALKKLIADGTYAAAYRGVPGMSEAGLTPAQVIINPLTKTPVGTKQ